MSFAEMQAGELAWWKAFLAQPHALARLFAMYGYRYLPFFFEEFTAPGQVIDFGSGPVSAAYIADPAPTVVTCIDPLLEAYRREGLVYGDVLSPESYQRVGLVYRDVPPSATGPYDTALALNVLDHTDAPLELLRSLAASLGPSSKGLIWVHIDQPGDSLHLPVTAAAAREWLGTAGLLVRREHVGPQGSFRAYMAVVTR